MERGLQKANHNKQLAEWVQRVKACRKSGEKVSESLPKGKARNSSAAQGLAYCNLLFKIEEELVNLSPEERYDQLLKQAKPVLDAMLAWANTRTAAPKSALGKAFTYLKD